MFNNQSKMDMRLATTRQREGVGLPVRFKPGTHRWMRTFPTFQVEEDDVVKGFNDMKDAVEIAFRTTDKGKVCLLSAASSSFSVFKDYIDESNQFKKYIRKHV